MSSVLDPKPSLMSTILLWQDPIVSASVFVPSVLFLLASKVFSMISVMAYSALSVLLLVISSKIYWYVMVFLLKKLDNVPEADPLHKVYGAQFSVSKESVQGVAETLVDKINFGGTKLKSLFLCDNLVETGKFGFFLYCLTFLGSLFDLLTLLIICWISLFTLPKVYTDNQEFFDKNIAKMNASLQEVSTKVQGFVPKKSPRKEE